MTTDRAQRTRTRLRDTALALFEARGYDATTAADIAAAAGVSEMTFFRHFPSKAALLLDDPYDPLIAASVTAAGSDLPLVVRISDGLRQAYARLSEGIEPSERDAMRRRLRVAAATPSLRPAVLATTASTVDAVVDHLGASGADPDAARVAATAVLAGVTEALLLWAGTADPDAELGDALTAACDVLAGRP